MNWLLLLACSGSDGVPEANLTMVPVAEVPLLDPEGTTGRPRKRMNIDQLSATIEATSGYAWSEEGVRLFDALSTTLGKPEYLDSTEEEFSPGLLFQKFLDDAAKQTCRRRVADDASAPAENRLFVVPADPNADPSLDPATTRLTLQRALLHFHGRTIPADHPDLDRWEWLANTAYERTGTGMVAWRAVCVGLMTHPDFYSY